MKLQTLLKLAVNLLLIIQSSFALLDTRQDDLNTHKILWSNLRIYIEWNFPVWSGGGYCTEGTAYIQALDAYLKNTPHQLSLWHHGDRWNRGYTDNIDKGLESKLIRINAVNPKSDTYDYKVSICHSEPGAWNVLNGPRYHTASCPQYIEQYSKNGRHKNDNIVTIGRTMFETDRIPSGWASRINALDELWVPTKTQADIFSDGGVDIPISNLFEVVDTAYFDPSLDSPDPLKSRRYTLPPSSFVFLSVFKFEDRKGYDILLSSYFEEFKRGVDNVALVILVSGYHSKEGATTDLESFCENRGYECGHDSETLPPIFVLSGVSSAEMRSLYQTSDVFVLPSRGEGWGRPHVEAMSMGVPIIATEWGGPTEYMTANNSYPLPIEGMTGMTSSAFVGHKWAEPSKTELKKIMRRVVENPEEVKEKGKQARKTMTENYNLEAGAKEIMRLIGQALWRKFGGNFTEVRGGVAEEL